MIPTHSPPIHRGLDWLVRELDVYPSSMDESSVRQLLNQAEFTVEDVASYIEPRATTYARRCVVRRENYELLVLTWLPSQGSVAHDHSGSLCGLKVVQGCLTEQLFQRGPDGQVRKTTSTQLNVGEITVDPGVVVHSLANDATSAEPLVTVHVYSPPLPEVRRYAVTQAPPAAVFLRLPQPSNPQVLLRGNSSPLSALATNMGRYIGGN